MQPIRNSAKALIIREGKLLAIQLEDERGYWYALPGGGQEPGEDLHAALRRECREEIGAEVVIGELRFVRDYIGRNHEFAQRHADIHVVDLIFECGLAEGEEVRMGPVADTNALDVVWLDIDKLDSYRLYPLGLRSWLIRYANGEGAPIYLGDLF